MAQDFEQVEIRSRSELRRWLEKHHEQTTSIWLVTFKKRPGLPHVPYNDIVEEALCFGWVDSQPRKLDDDRAMLRLSPRSPRSAWSNANKERVARLIEAGLMHPAGLARVEAAKKSGLWDKIAAAQANVVPPDLKSAFRRHAGSAANFDAFPPSAKRAILEWIEQARTPETRERRVSETARLAAENIRANQWRQPKG